MRDEQLMREEDLELAADSILENAGKMGFGKQGELEEIDLALPDAEMITGEEPVNLNDVEEVPVEDVRELSEFVESYASEDSVHMYLKEMGKISMLTPEEEIELARRIRAGDDEAKQKMLTSNGYNSDWCGYFSFFVRSMFQVML